LLLNLKELMKIIFTREEVLELVLEHVWQVYPRAAVNFAELDRDSAFENVVVSFVKPSEPEVPAVEESTNE